jgi:hypothetical protein
MSIAKDIFWTRLCIFGVPPDLLTAFPPIRSRHSLPDARDVAGRNLSSFLHALDHVDQDLSAPIGTRHHFLDIRECFAPGSPMLGL